MALRLPATDWDEGVAKAGRCAPPVGVARGLPGDFWFPSASPPRGSSPHTGQSGILLTPEESGFRVRASGTAEAIGLRPGDLLLLVDGEEARTLPDPVRALEGGERELTILRDGQPLRLKGRIGPSPWDTRYLLLLLAGAAFLVATGVVLRTAPHEADPVSHFLFAGFAFTAAAVLVITPAPPYDALFRATTLLEDAARAFLPAFLLAFVFRFPRRATRIPGALFFVPALALTLLSLATYLNPPAADIDATPLVLRLDRLQQAALLLGVSLAVARLVSLATRRLDLLAEKQVRFLLAGTAGGLLPVVLLDFLPRLLGGPIPVVSSFSIVPLVLVPAAFLAALTRYRLWDVEILTRETVALLGAAFLGAGLFSLAQVADLGDVLPGIPYGRGLVETGRGAPHRPHVLPGPAGASPPRSRGSSTANASARGKGSSPSSASSRARAASPRSDRSWRNGS